MAAIEFDILQYMSGLTGFTFDKAVLVRIALERGVSAVTEYAQQIRKALKTYKKANKFMWIFSISFILLFAILVATSLTINGWTSRGIEGALGAFFICFIIGLVLLVAYFISNVYVTPDVELKLEIVLEDLGKDNQEA